ncbi:SulP family inorganic anion transporter [Salinibius halmophilus]
MLLSSTKQDWLGNVKGDVLAGIVVALALIPEAIAFSILAGVDPKVGLYASFTIAVIIAFVGGRPGMISAATGAMAILVIDLVKNHGLEYLLVATVLTGILQMIAGYLQLGNLMRFVSKSVMTGFVNALAIIIFMAQLPELIDVTWHVYAMVAFGLGIIYLLPLVTTAVPSPLVTIVVCTLIAYFFGLDIRTVGDMGELPDTLPVFLFPDVPWNLETLGIVLPYAVSLTIVGLMESLMTAQIVDDLTDTKSDKNRECKGQGIANIITGFFGGMAGCAMIGQSVINVKSGGRGRLSTLIAGLLLIVLVVFLNDYVAIIPMAALVAVMIMVSVGTFSWTSITDMKQHPISTSAVMLTTVFVTLYFHNLAYGVLAGVLLAALFFASKIAHFMYVKSEANEDETERTYTVVGQVFFTSAEKFINSFDYKEALDTVTIDLKRAHFWDITGVSALDKVVIKFRREGTEVKVIGLNEASETIVDRFGVYDKPEELDKVLGGH